MAILTKIVLMGDGAVGKTSLRNSFMGERFTGDYLMTVGADFSLKEYPVTVQGKKFDIKFQIWDLAGQQRFEMVRAAFYNGTVGGVLVYDITRPDSFENTIKWLLELGKNSNVRGNPPPVILLGNKSDLREKVDNEVTKEQGQLLANTLPQYYCNNKFLIPFYETSAVNGQNVDLAFKTLGEMIIQITKFSSPAK